jgi:hypothetical protein
LLYGAGTAQEEIQEQGRRSAEEGVRLKAEASGTAVAWQIGKVSGQTVGEGDAGHRR